MKRLHKIAASIVGAAGLSLGASALYAQPGTMGDGMGSGMDHGMTGGMGPGMMQHSGFGGPGVAQQLMTPEERQAFAEKMRGAKTPEERQKLAQANRAEMEKRANEKGIALPEHRGPHAGFGPGFAPSSTAPAR